MAQKVLLHFNGADASTTFTDTGTSGITWVADGAAQLDTAQSKFGGASLLLDGTTDGIHASSAVATLLSAQNNWTIECFVRANNFTSHPCIWSFLGSGGYGCTVWIDGASHVLRYTLSSNGTAPNIVNAGTASGALSTGTWYHVAMVRDHSADNVYLYLDGVLAATVGLGGANVTSALTDEFIGYFDSSKSQSLDGWIDEFVITDSCKYPGGTTFTPPTSEMGGLDYSLTGTGGVVVGESAEVHPLDFSLTGTGGVVVGDSAVVEYQPSTDWIMTGGISIGGTATVEYSPAAHGDIDNLTLDGLSVVLELEQEPHLEADIEFTNLSVDCTVDSGMYATGEIELNGLSVDAFMAMEFALDLSGMSVEAEVLGGTYAECGLTFSGFSVTGTVIPEGYSEGSFTLNLLGVTATVVSEVIGSIDVTLPAMRVVATALPGRIGTADLTLSGLSVVAEGWPEYVLQGELTFTGLSVQGIIEEVLSAVFNTVTMNIELGGDSVTEFDDYNFNSYATFNGIHLGSSAGGLFELDGDDDDGDPIVANGLGGITNLDSDTQVKVPYAYLTARLNGAIAIVTRTGENAERKHAIQSDAQTHLHRRRVQLDGAPKSLEWQFGFENIEGSDFEISQLSILPVRTDRRI